MCSDRNHFGNIELFFLANVLCFTLIYLLSKYEHEFTFGKGRTSLTVSGITSNNDQNKVILEKKIIVWGRRMSSMGVEKIIEQKKMRHWQ